MQNSATVRAIHPRKQRAVRLYGIVTQLSAILANPAVVGGSRTLDRVALLADLLGFERWRVANLLNTESRSVLDFPEACQEAEPWIVAREEMLGAIQESSIVLLAYGVSEPTGRMRFHHRDQVRWLGTQLLDAKKLVVQVGDGPRHPSRWQRWTSRAYPGTEFVEALAASVRRSPLSVTNVNIGQERIAEPFVPLKQRSRSFTRTTSIRLGGIEL